MLQRELRMPMAAQGLTDSWERQWRSWVRAKACDVPTAALPSPTLCQLQLPFQVAWLLLVLWLVLELRGGGGASLPHWPCVFADSALGWD